MAEHLQKGKLAEQRAWKFLRKESCQLVEKNWHCRYGEIDLIVKQKTILIFIEVRYRRNSQFGGALASINSAKIAKLKRSAEYYLQKTGWQGECRFDAILIDGGNDLIWLKNILE